MTEPIDLNSLKNLKQIVLIQLSCRREEVEKDPKHRKFWQELVQLGEERKVQGLEDEDEIDKTVVLDQTEFQEYLRRAGVIGPSKK